MDIVDLIFADRKKEAQRIADQISIGRGDISSLIELSHTSFEHFPYFYAFKRFDTLPDHLHLTEQDLSALTRSNGHKGSDHGLQKALNKIFQFPEEANRSTAHLFYTGQHQFWHLFFFDIRDTRSVRPNWKGGPHWHYLSHLFTNKSCQEVWSGFCKDGRQALPKNGAHIRIRR